MLGILILLTISAILSGSLGSIWLLNVRGFSAFHLINDPPFGTLYNAFLGLFILSWGLDMSLHCIFVLKYWAASQKIKMCIETRIDPNFDLKAKVLFYVCIVWTIVSVSFMAYLYWDPQNENLKWFGSRKPIVGAIITFPPCLFLVLLIWAFKTMKNFPQTEHSIS